MKSKLFSMIALCIAITIVFSSCKKENSVETSKEINHVVLSSISDIEDLGQAHNDNILYAFSQLDLNSTSLSEQDVLDAFLSIPFDSSPLGMTQQQYENAVLLNITLSNCMTMTLEIFHMRA